MNVPSSNPPPNEPSDEAQPEQGDDDSAFEEESQYTDTESLRSSIFNFRKEHGRTYHVYGSTEHWGPNDDMAQEQQDISHHMWSLMLRGELYIAPVENPHRILDVGTGTGIWAIDCAEKHPEATVKGIDLSPIQPSWVPPNVYFEIDDFNLAWVDSEKYDLIHHRELLGSVPDWIEFYKKCFQALKPGGWIDCAEPGLWFDSFYVDLGPDDPYKKWSNGLFESGNQVGMSFDVGPYVKEWLEAAGFINVQEKKICSTVGKWSKDPWERDVGSWNQLRLVRGVEDFCSRRFVNQLHWSIDEVEILCARLRQAVKNNTLKVHQWFFFVVGQKPMESKEEA